MSFWGKYGSLGTVETATLTLQEIAKEITWEDLKKDDRVANHVEWYEANRLIKQIEGLQMVLWLNNAPVPSTWLPQYFKPENHAMYSRMLMDRKK